MTIPSLLRYAIGSLALAVLATACTNRATDCKANANCTDSSTAGSGGTSGQGGEGGSDTLGGGGSAKGGTSAIPTTTALPCGRVCPQDTPVCDPNKNSCVACLATDDCGGIAVCKTSTGTCVPCLADTDCSSPATPTCNLTTTAAANTCEAACTTDDDCTRFADTKACNTNTGACVACTAANETACGANSCNPATNACTTTKRASLTSCIACVADSECAGAALTPPAARCVPMTFGTDTSATRGSYCLAVATVTSCIQPFKVNFSASSVTGVAGIFCGVNQAATTCEAVLDMGAAKSCTTNASCGNGVGGLCQDFDLSAGIDLRCTIPCGSSDQCTSGKTCSSLTNGYCQ